jgi:hypothetical protein
VDRTHSYTYFKIQSNGEQRGFGLVGNERGIFNPEDITKALEIEPFRCWKKGDIRRGGTEYLFSSWSAEKTDINRLDVEAQYMDTIKNLKNKISTLQQIKEQYDVSFKIEVVPHIYGEKNPYMVFNKEIIEFCYLTGTTIEVDMYLFPDENINLDTKTFNG